MKSRCAALLSLLAAVGCVGAPSPDEGAPNAIEITVVPYVRRHLDPEHFLQDLTRTWASPRLARGDAMPDQVVFWLDEGHALPLDLHLQVYNDERGTGVALEDHGARYGAPGLRGVIAMGTPWQGALRDLARQVGGPRSLLGVLAQETAHGWATHARYRDARGVVRDDLLGRAGGHWSFYVDTGGSVLGGNAWVDLGDGTFRAEAPRSIHFHPLDLYFMGVVAANEIAPLRRLVPVRCAACLDDRATETVTLRTQADEVTLDQIVGAMGERTVVPSRHRTLQQAWVLVTRTEAPPAAAVVDGLRSLGARWMRVLHEASNGRLSVTLR
jgi:hypothetical protein